MLYIELSWSLSQRHFATCGDDHKGKVFFDSEIETPLLEKVFAAGMSLLSATLSTWYKPLITKAGLHSLPTRCVPSHLAALETDPSDDTADTQSSGTSSLSGSSANASGF